MKFTKVMILSIGKINGKITVKIVKLIVGAESASIADFIATKFKY